MKELYKNYKLYGPYLNKKDNRLRVILVNNLDKTKKTVSYPKYLMEIHLNRYLLDNETIDHIDKNPLNNSIENLQVLDRKIHSILDIARNEDVITKCKYCNEDFIIKGNTLHNRNRKDKSQSGYFCSKSCTGKYGKEIQLKRIKVTKEEKIISKKYHLKNN